MNYRDFFEKDDEKLIVDSRRYLHMNPEFRFELPNTLSYVKSELEKMGIEYTQKYGRSSLVAYIGKGKRKIGLRADMDALMVQEKNDVPYKSRNVGYMHACGHDGHTAILLGAARALKRAEALLKVTVVLIFQACEEGGPDGNGAEKMVADGLMDDLESVFALHVDPNLPCSKIGLCEGPAMAAIDNMRIIFKGKTAHGTAPQSSVDAIAIAVKFYNDLLFMLNRKIAPGEKFAFSICSFNAGTSFNVIADRCELKLTLRTFTAELHDFIVENIRQLAVDCANQMGGTSELLEKVAYHPVVFNDYELSKKVFRAIEEVVGKENTVIMDKVMISEDFSCFQAVKPGVMFRLGVRNEKKNCISALHCNDFNLDEDSLILGSQTFVQLILDLMEEKC